MVPLVLVVVPAWPVPASVPLVDGLFIEPAVPLCMLVPLALPLMVELVVGAVCARAAPLQAMDMASAAAMIFLVDIANLLIPPHIAARDCFDRNHVRRFGLVARKNDVKLC